MSKKGDARIARALETKLKQEEKSARLVERIKSEMPPERTVRFGANPNSIYGMLMDWTDDQADCEGDWSWGPRQWEQSAWDGVIAPKLVNFRTMTWQEIESATTSTGHNMHHSMSVESICDECQTRLLELEKVDGDIYRFRLGNRRRLWGFRVLHVFEILWYDPLHNVYPTDPD
jgi:hypothetical protein